MFDTVILEAAKRRAEREIEAERFRLNRRQELIEAAREQDEQERRKHQTQSKRVNWLDWQAFLREHAADRDYSSASGELSECLGFYVSPKRIANAIQHYDIEGRKRARVVG